MYMIVNRDGYYYVGYENVLMELVEWFEKDIPTNALTFANNEIWVETTLHLEHKTY